MRLGGPARLVVGLDYDGARRITHVSAGGPVNNDPILSRVETVLRASRDLLDRHAVIIEEHERRAAKPRSAVPEAGPLRKRAHQRHGFAYDPEGH